jgi:hypothetical protein
MCFRDFLTDQDAVNIVAACQRKEDAADLIVKKALEVAALEANLTVIMS